MVIDGLAFGVLPEAAAALHDTPSAGRARASSAGAGDRTERRRSPSALHASERTALSFAHRVVTTSAATARLLAADFGVPSDRLTVVRPGTDRATPAAPHASSATVALLAVGSVVPRKGYDVLVAALAMLADLPWRLVIVGDRSAQSRHRAEARRRDRPPRPSGRISFTGAVASEATRRATMRRPICSCCRRASRATAWPMPRRSRTACRWSAPPPARSRRRCRRRRRIGAARRCRCAGRRAAAADRKSRASGTRSRPAPRLPRPRFRPGQMQAALFAHRAGKSVDERLFAALARRCASPMTARRATPPCSTRWLPRSRDQSSIAVVDLACGTGATLRAIGARLPARQNWRLVDNDLSLLAQAAGACASAGCHGRGTPDRSRARSRACARWSDRSGHHLGAARSRLGRMARAAGGRSGGAPAADLCGAHLSGPRELRAGRAVRPRNGRRREPAPARRQGFWPRARPGGGAARA